VGLGNLGDRDDRLELRVQRAQQVGEPPGTIERDEDASLAVRKNSSNPAQVGFDLTRAGWRVERHRYCLRIERAVKCRKELAPRRQHDRDGLSGANAGPHEARGHRGGHEKHPDEEQAAAEEDRGEEPVLALANPEPEILPELAREVRPDAIIATGGLSRKDVVPVLVPNVIRGADDFMEGKIDGGFFAIGAAKVAEVHKSVGGIRYLPVPDDANALAAMRAFMPYAYVTEVKPSPAFVGLDGPTKLMAYDYLVAVGAHVKDDVVYKIAKAMYENKPKLVESLRAFNGFNPDDMHKSMPATFHPGSEKFYKEKGIGAK